MDTKLRVLPPVKRFRAMQQQEKLEVQHTKSKDQENVDPSSPSQYLPAKKRKESRHIPFLSEKNAPAVTTTTTYCLPTKKRVWAFPPEIGTPTKTKPLSPIDLNVEYRPPCIENEETKTEQKILTKSGQEVIEEKGVSTVNCCNRTSERDNQEIGGIEIGEAKEKIGFSTPNCSPNSPGLAGKEEEEVQVCINDEEEDDDGIVCAICQSTDGDPKDPIVFCDGCDLMVHTTCYGNPLIKEIPEGDWYCNQCLSSSEKVKSKTRSFSCCLCPNKGGALKSTSDGRWAHVVCALFVPEVFFHDSDGRDGIDCSKVPQRRWERRCYVCEGKSGCAIDCSEPKCPLAFHVSCGLNEDLCIEYREGKGKGDIVAGFCMRHTKLWEKQQQTGKFKIVAREEQQ